MWKIEFDDSARKELRKLDPHAQQRVLKWLRKNIEDTENPRRLGKPLKGRMKGLGQYWLGSWRITAQIQEKKSKVYVVRIAHPRDVYG